MAWVNTCFSSNWVLNMWSTNASAACATFLCLFNLECFICLPRARPVFLNVEEGEGTHRWVPEQSQRCVVLYNTPNCTLYCVVQGGNKRVHKNMHIDIMSEQTSQMFDWADTRRHTHQHMCSTAAWRGQFIHTEGQAEKDRWWWGWWCTSGFNSQGTPQVLPWVLPTQATTSWCRIAEG